MLEDRVLPSLDRIAGRLPCLVQPARSRQRQGGPFLRLGTTKP
jgi:hypothetical protein